MKFFSYALALVFLAFVIYVVLSFVHFVYVRVKAYVLSKKLSKLSETENNKDD